MVKIVVFLIVFISYGFSFIQKSQAKFYLSIGSSFNTTDAIEINPNPQEKIYKDFSFKSPTTEEKKEVCRNCSGGHGTSGSQYINIYETVTKNESSNYSPQGFRINTSINPSYTLSVGYNFYNNWRFEGEFRTFSFKKQLSELLTNFNVSNNITNQYVYSCDAIHDSDRVACTKNYSLFNYTKNYNDNYSTYLDLLKFASNNKVATVSFSDNINYYFLNFFYDIPLEKYIGVFTGLGAGRGTVNIAINTDLPINLSGSASFTAYQYKIGGYYQIDRHFRLSLSVTQINALSKIKFNKFEIKPISQSSTDFSLMYIL